MTHLPKNNLFLACLLAVSSVATAQAQSTKSGTPSKSSTLSAEARIKRLEDKEEVQHVMAIHAYYHGIGRNDIEYAQIWTKKQSDITFGQNQGYYVGHASIKNYYVDYQKKSQQRDLTVLKTKYPQIDAANPENLPMGELFMHSLTTPIIEIAGDGQTAKGVWYSPGFVTGVGGGNAHAFWCYEKYGVDFIREDGQWKIWHLHVYTDFIVPTDKSWAQDAGEAQMGSSTAAPTPGGMPPMPADMPKPDKQVITYKTYSPTNVPQLVRLPEPYRTFSETFSFANE